MSQTRRSSPGATRAQRVHSVLAGGAVVARGGAGRRWRYFVLDGDRVPASRFRQRKMYDCQTAQAWREIFESSTSESTWISSTAEKTAALVSAAASLLVSGRGKPRVLGDLVMLESPPAESLPAIHALFRRVTGEVKAFRLLPPEELVEVLLAPGGAGRDLLIGGLYDPASETLTLTRGNLETVVVPLSLFRPSGTSTPDPTRLSVSDYGHTVRLGDYEASADAILYEVDRDYRRRVNARRRQEEKGFGPSLRRLRLQRRLKRTDFRGISPKTIARLERGETGKPHGRTLGVLARVLGVEADEIETW